MNKPDIQLPRGCKLIKLPNAVDDRGGLSFVEGGKDIPFEIKRVFWAYRVNPGKNRGDHAHRTCSEVMFPVGGEYLIDLDDGTVKCTIRMSDPHMGLLIPPGVWCKLHHFSPTAACVCMVDACYDAADYIHSYDEFLDFVKQ